MVTGAEVAWKVGDVLPPLSRGPVSRQTLVEWCAAENDYYQLHYDERLAARMGLPATPIQGTFRLALMGQMLSRWYGARGSLKSITVSYRGLDLEGDTISACGKIAKVDRINSEMRIELEVWIENNRGEKSTTGVAVAMLPQRADA